MKLWDEGRFAALVDDTEAELRGHRRGTSGPRDDDARARAFNARALSGRLRSAVRSLSDPDESSGTIQAWYADDSAMVGKASELSAVMDLLLAHGPARGYFPEPSKSILVCSDADRPAAATRLSRHQFKFTDGHRYVGGFLGSDEARDKWLEPQVQKWAEGVRQLAMVAKRFPQTAYAGLTKSLQAEW